MLQESSSTSKYIYFRLNEYIVVSLRIFISYLNLVQMGRLFKAVQTNILIPRWFCHLYTLFYPYSHSKILSRHPKPQIPPKLSILSILLFYHFLLVYIWILGETSKMRAKISFLYFTQPYSLLLLRARYKTLQEYLNVFGSLSPYNEL